MSIFIAGGTNPGASHYIIAVQLDRKLSPAGKTRLDEKMAAVGMNRRDAWNTRSKYHYETHSLTSLIECLTTCREALQKNPAALGTCKNASLGSKVEEIEEEIETGYEP